MNLKSERVNLKNGPDAWLARWRIKYPWYEWEWRAWGDGVTAFLCHSRDFHMQYCVSDIEMEYMTAGVDIIGDMIVRSLENAKRAGKQGYEVDDTRLPARRIIL